MEKKVLIDLEMLESFRDFNSGSIYLLRLLSAVKSSNNLRYILLIRKDLRQDYSDILATIKKKFPEFECIVFNHLPWQYLYRYKMPTYYIDRYRFNRMLRKHTIDCVLISTYRDPSFISYRYPCKKIITIHDMSDLTIFNNAPSNINPFTFKKRQRLYTNYIQSADKVIAISKYTKHHILTAIPGVTDDKVHVVYNSVTMVSGSKQPTGFTEDRYILNVNTIKYSKNLFTLLRAFRSIANKTDKKLVIVGRRNDYWTSICLPYIERELPNRVVQLQDLSNEELRYVYEHASLFVTTSMFEGFGFSPIEAAIYGVPVVSSIETSLPDVTDGLVTYYFPSTDYEALAEKMLQQIQSPPSAERLGELSRHFSEKYDPKKQAKNIENIIKSIL